MKYPASEKDEKGNKYHVNSKKERMVNGFGHHKTTERKDSLYSHDSNFLFGKCLFDNDLVSEAMFIL